MQCLYITQNTDPSLFSIWAFFTWISKGKSFLLEWESVKSENISFYISLLEKQVDMKWKQGAENYLVAERKTLEWEKRGKKERCEKSGKRTNEGRAQKHAEEISQQRVQHVMGVRENVNRTDGEQSLRFEMTLMEPQKLEWNTSRKSKLKFVTATLRFTNLSTRTYQETFTLKIRQHMNICHHALVKCTQININRR